MPSKTQKLPTLFLASASRWKPSIIYMVQGRRMIHPDCGEGDGGHTSDMPLRLCHPQGVAIQVWGHVLSQFFTLRSGPEDYGGPQCGSLVTGPSCLDGFGSRYNGDTQAEPLSTIWDTKWWMFYTWITFTKWKDFSQEAFTHYIVSAHPVADSVNFLERGC